MTVSVQFHMMPAEVAGLFGHVASKAGVCTSWWRRPVKRLAIVDDWGRSSLEFRGGDAVLFKLGAWEESEADLVTVCQRNEDALVVEIGALSREGLHESWMHSMSMDEEVLRVWRSVAARLRRQTRAGGIAVNERTKARGAVRGRRFTDGARQFFYDGGVLFGPVPGVHIEIAE